jgi:glucans biosynthesis protein
MRLHLTLATLTVLLLLITLHTDSKHRFTFAQVDKIAQQRAQQKYAPLPNLLPPQLKNLNPQQEAEINWKDTYRLWRTKGLPFQVDFYHLSRAFPSGPRINTVDRKGAHPLAYSPGFFNFGNLAINPPLPATLPYAGFYLRYPIPTATEKTPNVLNGFFSVLGGNYFRVLAQDQVYGLSGRAVAVNTGIEGKPEEFPQFTDWWLHEPEPNATQLTLDAVLDSPSLTGAYEFKLRPGSVTSVDVHAVLYFRQAVARLGIAPFSSMYLYGENARNHFGDNVHPEIHDSDGVIINNSKGEWLWRPLQQATLLQLYNFADENPKGFGIVQRDRDFQHYQDLDALYNVRPSAWVTPHGDWGKGAIQVTQLVTNNTNTDNVVVFWRPDQQPKAGDRLELNYTIDFYMNNANRPPLAYASSTFINDPAPPPAPAPSISPALAAIVPVSSSARTPAPAPPKKRSPADTVPVQFLVDFVGDGIEDIPANSPPDIDLWSGPPGTVIRESKVEKNGYDNSWRVTFTMIPFKHHIPTEMKLRLFAHNTVKQIGDEIAQIHAQIDQDEKLLARGPMPPAKNGKPQPAAELRNLTKKILPQKENARQDAESRPISETWTYTWHQ